MERAASPVSSSCSYDTSLPYAPSDSPGSSVSTRLKDEYDELLKYAVVVPTYDPMTMPKSLTDFRGSFPRGAEPEDTQRAHHPHLGDDREEEGDDEDSGTEVGDSVPQGVDGAPKTQFLSQSTPLKEARTSLEKEKLHLGSRPEDGSRQVFFVTPEPDSPRSVVSSMAAEPAPVGGTMEEQCSQGFSLTIDQDVARMEGLMNTWLGDLNRNVLAEFGQSKIRMLEHYKHQLHKEKERHAADMNRLQNETESLKELLVTYEQSIERKDEVIANLTRAMQRQRDKFEMAKTFCEWKIRHNDSKREAFATNLAHRHYRRVLAQKVWDAWHSLVESKWRQRVERACQAKAQEVCMQLTNDYESRIASLNEALEGARQEVGRLHTERERYEETMKKAFMRGVCALNLEAMTMFHESGEGSEASQAVGEVPGEGPEDPRLGLPVTVPQEAMYTSSEPPGAPSPRIITSTGASSSRSTISQASTRSATSISSKTKAGQKGKVISAKITARTDTGLKSSSVPNVPMGLAPPMSSVIVERHQPVTKATIGQAKASQFPWSGSGQQEGSTGGIVQRRIAGQQKKVPLVTPNVQTIKMVE